MAHEHFGDALEAALAIKMLLMVCGHGNAEVPVALSVTIPELGNVPDHSVAVTDVDLHKGGLRYGFGDDEGNVVAERVVGLWDTFMSLLYGSERERFLLALRASEASRYAYDPRFALATLWVGPEAIFAKDPSEATFKLTAAWASFVESRGTDRIALHRRLQKLYGLRSKAVHGNTVNPQTFLDAYRETFVYFMNCIWKFIELGQLPTAEQLQTGILGD